VHGATPRSISWMVVTDRAWASWEVPVHDRLPSPSSRMERGWGWGPGSAALIGQHRPEAHHAAQQVDLAPVAVEVGDEVEVDRLSHRLGALAHLDLALQILV
jgi:hypothetical protein